MGVAVTVLELALSLNSPQCLFGRSYSPFAGASALQLLSAVLHPIWCVLHLGTPIVVLLTYDSVDPSLAQARSGAYMTYRNDESGFLLKIA